MSIGVSITIKDKCFVSIFPPEEQLAIAKDYYTNSKDTLVQEVFQGVALKIKEDLLKFYNELSLVEQALLDFTLEDINAITDESLADESLGTA